MGAGEPSFGASVAWLTVVEFLIVILLVPFYWPLIGIK
jgi:hypothetical protein